MPEKKFSEMEASNPEAETAAKDSKPFENEFVPYIHRWGRITNLLAAVLAFGPVLVLALVFGLVPSAEAIAIGSISILSVIAVFWFVEPLSYYPVLGIPGTYMAFLSGNISNMRLPCSAAAQEATGVEVSTKEGSIISTLGIAGSIFVNVSILSVGVLIGVETFQAIPEIVRSSIEAYIVPSIFGAVFVQFARDYLQLGAVALSIALPLLLLVEMGYLAMFPGPDPSYVVVIVSVFGTIAVARYMFRNGMIESPKKDTES